MSKTNRLSTLILAAFSAFLAIFIGTLALSRIEQSGYSCEVGAAKIATAKASADPVHALETLRVAWADHASCPGRGEKIN
jgi:hypothetical protein